MIISKDTVAFQKCDENFVKKFGVKKATEMVLEYKSRCNLPFIYDTKQLADFLKINEGNLFHTVRNIDKMYHNIAIPKRNGDERILTVPNEKLKYLQKYILKNIIGKFQISKYATAYYKGATLFENAKPHINKKYLLKIDLEDFFDTINFTMVYSSVFNRKYFPKQIGAILTTFCCYEDTLPQGAPTSPAISNLVMKNFDEYFGKWCSKHSFNYTRYCDDIAVSGNNNVYLAYVKANKALQNMGFQINDNKTHIITNGNCQCVTGLTVNEKVTVSRNYKKKLRQEIYYYLKYGKDCIIHNNLKEYMCNGVPDEYSYLCYLKGKINYVLSVEKNNQEFIYALNEINRSRL